MISPGFFVVAAQPLKLTSAEVDLLRAEMGNWVGEGKEEALSQEDK